jgi:hypothetical protein
MGISLKHSSSLQQSLWLRWSSRRPSELEVAGSRPSILIKLIFENFLYFNIKLDQTIP